MHAEGSTLHVGDRSFDAGATVWTLDVTDDGAGPAAATCRRRAAHAGRRARVPAAGRRVPGRARWRRPGHRAVSDRVNVNGGGIALGHPIGATGTRLMATLLNELERTGGRSGLQTMCEGGGQANVTILERL